LFDVSRDRKSRGKLRYFATADSQQNTVSRAFAQILGKLYFLQLGENLRRILFDYGQKRPRRANAAFNAAC
jgi:hypothetical protein